MKIFSLFGPVFIFSLSPRVSTHNLLHISATRSVQLNSTIVIRLSTPKFLDFENTKNQMQIKNGRVHGRGQFLWVGKSTLHPLGFWIRISQIGHGQCPKGLWMNMYASPKEERGDRLTLNFYFLRKKFFGNISCKLKNPIKRAHCCVKKASEIQ